MTVFEEVRKGNKLSGIEERADTSEIRDCVCVGGGGEEEGGNKRFHTI